MKSAVLGLHVREWVPHDRFRFAPARRSVHDDAFRNALNLVRKDGLNLQNLSEFQDDFAIVYAAVQQNGEALQFASRRLQGSSRVALAAIRQNPSVSPELKEGSNDQAIRFRVVLNSWYKSRDHQQNDGSIGIPSWYKSWYQQNDGTFVQRWLPTLVG